MKTKPSSTPHTPLKASPAVAPESAPQEQQPPGLLSVIQSTLAAAFGVQSDKKRVKDFTHGRPLHFIIAGVVFTLVFVLVLLGITNLVV